MLKRFWSILGVIAFSASVFAAGSALTIDLGNGITLPMVKIAAGSFTMGSPVSESFSRDNEVPHTVTLTQDYYMGATEVTQDQWFIVMGTMPSKQQGNGKLPVECVSWDDAMAFCAKLTEMERSANRLGRDEVYTLPTEAQWEYACRAGSQTPFAFGNVLDGTMANIDGNHPYGETHNETRYLNATTLVGSYAPNAWGLYDMHGNVMEWCLDCYVADLGKQAATDPFNDKSETSQYRVYRGGNYRDIAGGCRSAQRYFNLPHFKYNYLGFRVARVKVSASSK